MAERTSWELEEGAELDHGRYVLGSLGGGELCETYLGWDDDLFALVVFKVMRPSRVGDERSLRDLAREAEMLSTVNHPVIVRGYGAVLEGQRPYLVLEHLDGPMLRTVLRRFGAMPLEQVLPLALHLCSALHHLHRRELVHLDLKPRNIIMGPTPRLIDLSIARTFEGAARLGPGVGTRRYMAPEQVDPAGLGAPGPPADIWGLGVTLFECITGRRAFPQPGEGYPQMDNEIDWSLVPRHVPAAVVEPLRETVDRDPALRPTASALALALEPVVSALPGVTASRKGLRFRGI